MGPTVSLDIVEKKISCSCQESNLGCPLPITVPTELSHKEMDVTLSVIGNLEIVC
jgi:hypothetical protein